MKRKQKYIAIVLFVISICALLFSSYKIITWLKANNQNKKIDKNTKKYITIEKDKYKVDFEELKIQNPDTICYLKVNGTNIDYIVVKANDNNYYLDHNFEKKYNISGWIFSDYRNKFDETDKNIIIYGHNTKDGSMFGTLKNILNKSWNTKENREISLVTESKQKKYRVFSVYQIKTEDYYIKTDFTDDFPSFVEKLKSRSIYPFNEDISQTTSILTLSTCSESGLERVVLHAREV